MPLTARTDNAPKVRFSAGLGEEPQIDLKLVLSLRARNSVVWMCLKPTRTHSLTLRFLIQPLALGSAFLQHRF